MVDMQEGAPVFIRLDEYKEVLDVLTLIKNKIRDGKEILAKIDSLKNEEDAELDLWKTSLAEVERKVGFIDTALFEPGNL